MAKQNRPSGYDTGWSLNKPGDPSGNDQIANDIKAIHKDMLMQALKTKKLEATVSRLLKALAAIKADNVKLHEAIEVLSKDKSC